ncbi:MAG: WD40/YVTN/BNR-like repeat-containing protein, partial [Blastocatellia bacterium]
DDGGASWKALPTESVPAAMPEEGAFAASGTCITAQGNSVWFATGGGAARVFHSTDRGETWSVAATEVVSGEPAAGIFSLAFSNEKNGIAVGGNYKREADASSNSAFTVDGGRTWKPVPGTRPAGYRSAAAYVPGTGGRAVIAVGPSGTDCSSDGGRTWVSLGHDGFDAISFSKSGTAGWAAGEGGRIAKYAGGRCQAAGSSAQPK